VTPLPDGCRSFDANGDNAVDTIDYSGDAAHPPQFTGFWKLIDSATTGGPKLLPTP
jgi:hypothetical protein